MREKNIYKITGLWIWMFLSILLHSCTTEGTVMTETEHNEHPKEEIITLSVFSDTNDFQQPVSTRAVGDFDINTLMVLVFRATGNGHFLEAAQGKVLGAKNGSVSLINRAEPCSLLVITNIHPDQTIFYNSTEDFFTADNLNNYLTGLTINQVSNMLSTQKLSVPHQGMPFDGTKVGIPMAGLTRVNSLQEGASIGTVENPVILTRVAARIEVRLNDNIPDVELLGATVANVSRNTLIYNWNSTLTANPGNLTRYESTAADKLEGLVDVTHNTANNWYQTGPIYVHETHQDENPMIIVKMKYKGIAYYYKLNFYVNSASSGTSGNRTKLSIERDKYYTIRISDVTSPGHRSVDAAMNDPAINLLYKTDIIDASSAEIVSNGNYYMGLSNSEYIFYSDKSVTQHIASAYNNIPVSSGVYNNTVTTSGLAGFETKTDAVSNIDLSQLILDGTTSIYASLPIELQGSVIGVIQLNLMNMEQEITVSRQPSLNAAGEVAIDVPGTFISAEVEDGNSWLTVSNNYQQFFSNKVSSVTPQILYIKATSTTIERTGYIDCARRINGTIKRVRLSVTQSGD